MKELWAGVVISFVTNNFSNMNFKVIFLSVRNGPSVTVNVDSIKQCPKSFLHKKLKLAFKKALTIIEVCIEKIFLTSDKNI